MEKNSMYRLRRKLASIYIQELDKLFPNLTTPLNYFTPFQFLVAVILSAQTTDRQVNIVTKKLFSKFKSINDFASLEYKTLEREIRSIGLYKSKAKYIIDSAKELKERYKGAIPCSISELIKLPGVGRKTANVVISELCNKNEGIAVDTHVKRLSKILALTNSNDPVKIERDLMNEIPSDRWKTFSLQLIFYGRKFCPARKAPKDTCVVGDVNPENPYKDCPLSLKLRDFFRSFPVVVVGVSHNPQKYGARIFRVLLGKDYCVNGVNPKGGIIEGKKIYRSVSDVIKNLSPINNILLLFVVPPSVTYKVISDLKIRNVSIWLQPGSYDKKVLNLIKMRETEVFYGECFMKLNGWW